MSLDRTPITYIQAVSILGKTMTALKEALADDRAVLTKLPRTGRERHLMRGQVMLFKGKQLSLSSLNDDEKKLWQAYTDSVNPPVNHDPVQEGIAFYHQTGMLLQDLYKRGGASQENPFSRGLETITR